MLDSRQTRIAFWLLGQPEPRSAAEAGTALNISPRVFRYNLPAVDRFLADHQLALQSLPGVGVWVDGDEEHRRSLLAELGDATGSYAVFGPDDRRYLALCALLAAAPEPLLLDELADQLEVSRTTARRDVSEAEAWLHGLDLHLLRKPGIGILVGGTEGAIRAALVKMVLEAVPSDVLFAMASEPERQSFPSLNRGLRQFLSNLDLSGCYQVIAEDEYLSTAVPEGATVLSIVYLAVLAYRAGGGHSFSLPPGRFRSLEDHPVATASARVAARLEQMTGVGLHAEEAAAITEHLLGVASLGDDAIEPHQDAASAASRIMAIAAQELHPSLEDDHYLAASLEEHIRRLIVRLRYHLPIHNPLLNDIKERYPDVHAVARTITGVLEPILGRLPEDEAGYLTMYLGGALERNRLTPRRRAVVVCPAGMATVWILVSRLQAEFPELDIVSAVSRSEFASQHLEGIDLVISTVDLGPEPPVAAVIVHPLLNARDIRKVARALKHTTPT